MFMLPFAIIDDGDNIRPLHDQAERKDLTPGKDKRAFLLENLAKDLRVVALARLRSLGADLEGPPGCIGLFDDWDGFEPGTEVSSSSHCLG